MENIKPIGAVKWTLHCKKDQLAEITSKIVDWLPGNIQGTFVLALDILNTSGSSQNLFKNYENLVPELKKLTGVFPSSYSHFRSNQPEYAQLKDFLNEGWIEADSFIVFIGRQGILGAWDMSGGDFKIIVGEQLAYDTALSLAVILGTRLDELDLNHSEMLSETNTLVKQIDDTLLRSISSLKRLTYDELLRMPEVTENLILLDEKNEKSYTYIQRMSKDRLLVSVSYFESKLWGLYSFRTEKGFWMTSLGQITDATYEELRDNGG